MKRLRDLVLPAIVFVAAIAVWQTAHAAGSLPNSVASPAQIYNELLDRHELLWFHSHPTLVSSLWGFLAATAAAFGLALIVAIAPTMGRSVYTVAVVVASVPLIALTPILVLWLERGSAVRITIAAIASFFPVLIGAIEGLTHVSRDRAELFELLSASRWQRVMRLQMPSAVPLAVAGLRAAGAGAILGAIIAEWSGGSGARGLGTLMSTALFGFNVPLTWLTITTAVVLSIAAYFIVSVVTGLAIRRFGHV